MKTAYLLGAILFICIAHYIRVERWKLFIEIYEKPQKRNLLQSLSLGYLLNYFLPYKLGDLFRAWMSGRKMKNGKSLGLSTVVMDRYLDILAVGIIFVGLFIGDASNLVIKKTALFYLCVSVILIVLTMIIYLFRGILKKFLKAFAKIFNSNIEAIILRFAWALIWNFKDIFLKISKVKMLITTVGMWIFYLVSYYFFAAFLSSQGDGISWIDVFTMLFAQNSIKASTFDIPYVGNTLITLQPLYMMIYAVSPLIILLVGSLLVKRADAGNEHSNTEIYLNLLPQLDLKERLDFLENYFSNQNREYITNYLKINQGISIIRDYSAGSNATTMLCMDNDMTFFRKYAFGEDGEKLYQQILWIESNKEILPLPQILRKEKDEIYCYYDMPYSSNTVGLFEYVHSMPLEQGWNMIRSALESLEESIYKINVRTADKETIHSYIESKVNRNLEKIKNAKKIRALQGYDTIFINGIEYKNISYYEKFLQEDFLQDIFKNDLYAVIHGDLTIENIICKRDQYGKDNFYIIDPNTGNLHDSPNLDYGKLLQSIHGGYEFLMSTKNVEVTENRINFLFTKSSAYIQLHELLKKYMKEKLGEERTRSIYFHEIIHWLRLMPYKIEKDGKRALLFYAGMLIVMNDVIQMYCSDLK